MVKPLLLPLPLAFGLACLSMPVAQATESAPVPHFTFRLAGIDATLLTPEVEKVVAVCNLKGVAPNESLGTGRKDFPVTQVNGENVVHTGPFNIGVNFGQNVNAGDHLITEVQNWECHFELVRRGGGVVSAAGPCTAEWACPKPGAPLVASQSGHFTF
ncbi:MAG: hypothetical protein PHH47_05470 [Gallionella sp.]|nr:hypothetical protein [Gallionella sp.]MDD4945531.1 hypothetical protein [Gallionella sp.]MDD5611853.1 hypothetical protein [Gallionella sp.]